MGELEQMSNNLRSIIPNLVVVDQEPSPSTFNCTACQDAGWVRREEGATVSYVECGVCANVAERRSARYFRNAKIPARFGSCTFESYPYAPETKDAVASLLRWCSPGIAREDEEAWDAWVDWHKEGVFLYGPYGSGKTGLMVSMLHALNDRSMLFLRTPELLDAIRATYNRGSEATEQEVIDAAKRVEILALDDLGAERPTEWAREKLFDIINYRHDALMDTLFTSNLSLEDLAEHIGERTTWRIQEMCVVVHVDGPNLRVRGS